MTNEIKLLRAFIKASGYEIEEVSNGKPEIVKAFWDRPAIIKEGIDYKVTKKATDKTQDMVAICEILTKHNMSCIDFVMTVKGEL